MSHSESPIPEADLDDVQAEQFAQLISAATDEQIGEIVNGPARKRVLDAIFSRMADHVDPARVGALDAVVHFKILERPAGLGGGFDHYEVVFERGACTASDRVEHEPRVTISVGPVQFLKLAAGRASGPVLFLNGELRVEGDVDFASRLTGFFRIPTGR